MLFTDYLDGCIFITLQFSWIMYFDLSQNNISVFCNDLQQMKFQKKVVIPEQILSWNLKVVKPFLSCKM